MSESLNNKELVAKLRFPAFRKLKPWVTARLDQLGNIVMGGTPDTFREDFWSGDVPWATPPDLSKLQGPYLTKTLRYITRKGLDNCASALLPAGALVISTRASLGHIAITSVPMALNQSCNGILANAGNDERFLYYAVRRQRSQIIGLGAGNTFKGLSITSLSSVRLEAPSFSEQVKIAECLESLDELIAAEMEKLEALRRHKKGLLQRLFPAEGETTPRLRYPDFSMAGGWLEGSIGELGDVVTGTTPSTTKREFYGTDVLFASPADISRHRIVSETANGLSTLGARQARLVAPGSSLFVCIGSTIGKVAQNAEACATNQQINAVVSDSERFHPDFVYYLLLTKANIVRDLAGKQAVPLVSKTVFCSVRVEFPLIDEQRAIANLLNELDRAQSAVHHFMETLRTHKAALMQQLFPAIEELDALA